MKQRNSAPRWASPKEVADHLSVSLRTVEARMADGTFRSYRLPRSRMVRLDILEVDEVVARGGPLVHAHSLPTEAERAVAR